MKNNLYNTTPIITQYLKIKNKYKNILLLYRMGDFYEFLFEDAHKASALLNIQLTSKGKYNNKPIPMAGIPYHSINTYLKRIITNGISVAICEQIKNKKTTNTKLIERKVIRVITPGTIYEENLLDENKDNLILSIIYKNTIWGLSWLEFTTGAFGVLEVNNTQNLVLELERLNPVELLIPSSTKHLPTLPIKQSIIKHINDDFFNYNNAYNILHNKLNIKNIDTKLHNGVSAAGAIIQYINNNKIGSHNLSHINHLIFEKKKYNLNIDLTTKKHLELDINVNGKQENTLFSVLNTTMTNMGSRLLKKWINNPITNYKLIELRQNAIKIIINNDLIYILQKNIKKIGDIERIITRIALKKAKPIDLIKLKNALKVFPKIKNILKRILKKNQHIKSILNNIYLYIFIYPNIDLLLHDALLDNPPNTIRDGYVIKSHFNLKLDTLREIYKNSEKYIRKFENKEKIRTGIYKLKINFNKLNGFFIELPKNKHYKIPKEYIKNKTLKHSERFYSKELKSFEKLLIESKENSIEYEKKLYKKIINILIHNINCLLKTSKAIAALDVITTLSERAISLNFCKPIINKNKIGIKIIEGRHPIIESVNKHQFIPNNLYLNHNHNINIITGPNMGGKSTYIRQNAIIVLLTYIGSYVPAKYAEIGPIDKIFTRIGSYDDLSAGKSTFMIEMHETANILNTATFKSLVLMDEIGRGTNPTEGLSIAWACLEKLIQIKALTLFSTHYFSLTKIDKKFKQIKNIHFNALINHNKITYMYNINKGATNNSYSLTVASLANIPHFIINKSTHILTILKKHKTNNTKIYHLINFIKTFKIKKITIYLKFFKTLINKIKNIT